MSSTCKYRYEFPSCKESLTVLDNPSLSVTQCFCLLALYMLYIKCYASFCVMMTLSKIYSLNYIFCFSCFYSCFELQDDFIFVNLFLIVLHDPLLHSKNIRVKKSGSSENDLIWVMTPFFTPFTGHTRVNLYSKMHDPEFRVKRKNKMVVHENSRKEAKFYF